MFTLCNDNSESSEGYEGSLEDRNCISLFWFEIFSIFEVEIILSLLQLENHFHFLYNTIIEKQPELYNFVIYYNSNNNNIGYGFNYSSLLLSGRQQHQQWSFNDSYIDLILEEAEKIYNKLITKLTDRVIAAAGAIRASSLPEPGNNNTNKQKCHKIDNTYQTEELRYNQNRNL